MRKGIIEVREWKMRSERTRISTSSPTLHILTRQRRNI
nr:MAG TPA: hypothetical protein [Caudoviricetes sp.]